jgi:hypothetical protein
LCPVDYLSPDVREMAVLIRVSPDLSISKMDLGAGSD